MNVRFVLGLHFKQANLLKWIPFDDPSSSPMMSLMKEGTIDLLFYKIVILYEGEIKIAQVFCMNGWNIASYFTHFIPGYHCLLLCNDSCTLFSNPHEFWENIRNSQKIFHSSKIWTSYAPHWRHTRIFLPLKLKLHLQLSPQLVTGVLFIFHGLFWSKTHAISRAKKSIVDRKQKYLLAPSHARTLETWSPFLPGLGPDPNIHGLSELDALVYAIEWNCLVGKHFRIAYVHRNVPSFVTSKGTYLHLVRLYPQAYDKTFSRLAFSIWIRIFSCERILWRRKSCRHHTSPNNNTRFRQQHLAGCLSPLLGIKPSDVGNKPRLVWTNQCHCKPQRNFQREKQ